MYAQPHPGQPVATGAPNPAFDHRAVSANLQQRPVNRAASFAQAASPQAAPFEQNYGNGLPANVNRPPNQTYAIQPDFAQSPESNFQQQQSVMAQKGRLAASNALNGPLSEDAAEKMLLHSYIYDYLYRNNLKSAAWAFLQESPQTPISRRHPKSAANSNRPQKETSKKDAQNKGGSPLKEKEDAGSPLAGSPSSSHSQNSPTKSDQADPKTADPVNGNSDGSSTNSSDNSSLSHFGFSTARDNLDTTTAETSPSMLPSPTSNDAEVQLAGYSRDNLPEPMVEFTNDKGFLFTWWTVHWDIMMAMKQRQASQGARQYIHQRHAQPQQGPTRAQPIPHEVQANFQRQQIGPAQPHQTQAQVQAQAQSQAHAQARAQAQAQMQQGHPANAGMPPQEGRPGMTPSQAELQHARFAQTPMHPSTIQQMQRGTPRRVTLPAQASPAMQQAQMQQRAAEANFQAGQMPIQNPNQPPNAQMMQAMMQQHQQSQQNRGPNMQMAQHQAALQRQEQQQHEQMFLQRPPSSTSHASPHANVAPVIQRQPSRTMQRMQENGQAQMDGMSPASMPPSPAKRPRQIGPLDGPGQFQPMPSAGQQYTYNEAYAAQVREQQAQMHQQNMQARQQQQQASMIRQMQNNANGNGMPPTQAANGIEAYRQQISTGLQQQLLQPKSRSPSMHAMGPEAHQNMQQMMTGGQPTQMTYQQQLQMAKMHQMAGPLSPAIRQDQQPQQSPRPRMPMRAPQLPPNSPFTGMAPADGTVQLSSAQQMPPPPLPANGRVTPTATPQASGSPARSTIPLQKVANEEKPPAANSRKRPAEGPPAKNPPRKRPTKNNSNDHSSSDIAIPPADQMPQPLSTDLTSFPTQPEATTDPAQFDWQNAMNDLPPDQGVPTSAGFGETGDSSMFDLFMDSNFISWDGTSEA